MKASLDHFPTWSDWPYRIGCPVWNCKAWKSVVVPERSPASENLGWYSRMFGTVEGNSTFYGMPSEESFQRWANSVEKNFAFCYKFPQHITHECELDLQLCQRSLDTFLERLRILNNCSVLGPTFLQLGPRFCAQRRPRLQRFLDQLPSDLPWAVEVRHLDWFDEGEHEAWFDQLLRDRGIDRVLFDSSPLYSLPPTDAIEKESQNRKPRSPLRTTVTAKSPFVRLIGRNRFEEVEHYWDEWSERIADWILSGLKPFIFTHAPDDAFAPMLAREMHERIRLALQKSEPSIDLPSLPTLVEPNRNIPSSKPTDRQLRLFDL